MIPADREFLLLIDASSYFHRAYHAASPTRRRVDDLPTGAILNFSWSLMKLTRNAKTALKRRPRYAAIIMDADGHTMRHDIFPDYKAQRPEKEADLKEQMAYIPVIAEAFNIPCIKIAGYEADDIIATYCYQAAASKLFTVIASSDKDLCQLVGPTTILYDAMKDKDPERFDTKGVLMDIDAVREKWGVFPWEMVDLQALMGDTVDNVPGAKDIGPKKGAAIVKEFGNVEAAIAAADFDDVHRFPSQKIMERVLMSAADIMLSKQLVELAIDVPVPLSIEQLYRREPHPRVLKDFLLSMEAPQLARRVDE